MRSCSLQHWLFLAPVFNACSTPYNAMRSNKEARWATKENTSILIDWYFFYYAWLIWRSCSFFIVPINESEAKPKGISNHRQKISSPSKSESRHPNSSRHKLTLLAPETESKQDQTYQRQEGGRRRWRSRRYTNINIRRPSVQGPRPASRMEDRLSHRIRRTDLYSSILLLPSVLFI